MYCVKCRKRTETSNERLATSKNGKRMKRDLRGMRKN